MSREWRKAVARGEVSVVEQRAWMECLAEVLLVMKECKSLEDVVKGVGEMVHEAMPKKVVK
jgi:hypothetical protein